MNEPRDLPTAADDGNELPPALREALSTLRRDQAPSADLWSFIEARIADPAEREHCELPAEMQQALKALATDQAPSRDLWPAIDGRIRVRRSGTVPHRRWLAAGTALAACLVAAFSMVINHGPASSAAAGVASNKAPLRPSAEVLAATLGNGHDAELRTASYRPISRETRALMRANLKIVQSAETQIQRALADDPDDAAYLKSLLDSANAQQRHLSAELASNP
ncbi:hypothetical protein [Nevskia ramosa]|uniref:hypothetical protein n=1 Tax=Nevskia ramosa TaxID=64002 RepID=UPI0003B5D71C|nr:hypothetical protein [Nevskia ramosa]